MRRKAALAVAGCAAVVAATVMIMSVVRQEAVAPKQEGRTRPAAKAVVIRCGTQLPPEQSGRAVGTDIAVVRLTNPTAHEAEVSVDIAFNRDGKTSAIATGTALVPPRGTGEVTLQADGPPAQRGVITGGLMKCIVERVAAR